MKWSWYNYFDVYTKEQCDYIQNRLLENRSDYYKDRPGVGKKVNTYLIETTRIKDDLKLFFKNVYQANEEFFGFKLFGDPYTVNLNVYENDNNEYPYHRDAMMLGSMCDVKLTAILNLSTEDYSGGDFDIFDSTDVTIPEIKKCGNMLIFPSSLCHRVKPVISGKRVTVSAWFTGPNWR